VRRCCFVRTGKRRSRRERVLSDPELMSIPDPSPMPDEIASTEDLYDEVKKALDSLPADHREILILREVRQSSYREISELVGVPLGTVMSRLSRARRSLQRKLRPTLDPEEVPGGRRSSSRAAGERSPA
jgi:RNA polymerase sigma-70 factor (ECF subfamily)